MSLTLKDTKDIKTTAPDLILKKLATLREKKKKGKKEFELLDKILAFAHDYVVTLYLEKALFYQHSFMEERSKPKDRQNQKVFRQSLKGMRASVEQAMEYVEKYELKRWLSRVCRFLGRVADYSNKFDDAMGFYKKAIKESKHDPEFTEEGVPRWLEYEAFLAYSLMMSGELEKGLKFSKTVWKKFFDTREARKLRRNDYPTWAIWATGIPIRTAEALLKKSKDLDKKEIINWLKEAEKLIRRPRTSKKWKGMVDFGFRKEEVATLKRKLK
jgi:tetratricopeptide (TPR) repeat protein